MTRWKGKSSPPRHSVVSSDVENNGGAEDHRSAQFHTSVYNNESDDDIYSSTINTYLLFPKEESLSALRYQPLFPSAASRKNFIMMTCKRTLFGCRGLLLFCLIIFVIVSLVASYNNTIISNSSDSGNISGSEFTTVGAVSYHTVVEVTLPLPISEEGNYNGTSPGGIKMTFRNNCGYRRTDYASIANSLGKALEFYERNLERITVLDAALGGRILEEQLKMILVHHQKLPVELVTYLTDMKEAAGTLSDQITENVKKAANSTEELRFTLPWLKTENLWELPLNGKWFPVGHMKHFEPAEGSSYEDLWDIHSRQEVIDETISDVCIYQVFQCRTENITDQCKAVFLDIESSMYSLTHQVIYMLLARKNGCFEYSAWNNALTNKDGGQEFLERLCGKVWLEANSIADANFPPKFRDLFAEQVGMCALAGYPEFLRRKWLLRLMSWQSISTSGCFGRRKRLPPTVPMPVKRYQRRQKDNQQARLISENFFYDQGKHTKDKERTRYKRSDLYLEDEVTREKCWVHFTSVGIAALSMHLRYLFDSCFNEY